MLDRLKTRLKVWVKRDIRIYAFVRHKLMRLPFFLPQDIDYYALTVLSLGDGPILDIGANDGISARSINKLVPGHPIVSIEPNSVYRPVFEELQRKLPAFRFEMIAAGDEEGEIELYTPIYRGVPITAYASHDPDVATANLKHAMVHITDFDKHLTFRCVKVPVRTIDSLALNPSFVKIDIEGFEHLVLRGMKETLARALPVVMIEHNPHNFEKNQEILSQFDYRPSVFDYERRSFKCYDGGSPLNIFFLPPSVASSKSWTESSEKSPKGLV
ncbi:MAG: FkbM family methyltransferase [Kiloniellales bacterium]|nr:FkbM family methyltransferase [Kiloniellales bacterium]